MQANILLKPQTARSSFPLVLQCSPKLALKKINWRKDNFPIPFPIQYVLVKQITDN